MNGDERREFKCFLSCKLEIHHVPVSVGGIDAKFFVIMKKYTSSIPECNAIPRSSS
jgi:hypothetical protein